MTISTNSITSYHIALPQETANGLWCYDYVWDAGLGVVPPKGFVTRRLHPEVDTARMVCPVPKQGLVLVAFQNAGSGSLCNLVRLSSLSCPRVPPDFPYFSSWPSYSPSHSPSRTHSLLYFLASRTPPTLSPPPRSHGPSGVQVRLAIQYGYHLTVLGWEPAMTVRWTNFYLGSKLVSLLTMLKHCSPKWDPETTVVFTDSDVLIQRSASELLSSIQSAGYLTPQFQPDKKRRIVYSTELYNTMNFAADEPMQERRDKYAESLGRNISDYPYPFPNSGLFMGYAPDLRAWLEVLIAYRYKEKVRSVYFTRRSSKGLAGGSRTKCVGPTFELFPV